MKALLFNVPAHGHINPSLPLVEELTRRGHDITYFATNGYRASVEAAGATFRAYTGIEDDFFESRQLSGKVPQRVMNALMIATEGVLPGLLETTRAAQPDFIIYDCMCPWGCLTARILKPPGVVSMSLMPITKPPLRGMLTMLPMLPGMFAMLFRDFGEGMEANKKSRAIGKQYNVAPIGMMEFANAPGDIAISYTSAAFMPFAETASKTVRFVGRTISDVPADPSFSFERAKGRRIVYVSLGTVDNHDAEFFKTCIEAFTGSDYFVFMTTGNAFTAESFGALPENISIHNWIPQHDILRRAALFVSHAGLNSVNDGLYFGLPLLLIPQQGEQLMIANRVEELGAGLVIARPRMNAQTIRDTAARLLSEPGFKAASARVGESLRTAGGVKRAVAEIEAMMKGKQLA